MKEDFVQLKSNYMQSMEQELILIMTQSLLQASNTTTLIAYIIHEPIII